MVTYTCTGNETLWHRTSCNERSGCHYGSDDVQDRKLHNCFVGGLVVKKFGEYWL